MHSNFSTSFLQLVSLHKTSIPSRRLDGWIGIPRLVSTPYFSNHPKPIDLECSARYVTKISDPFPIPSLDLSIHRPSPPASHSARTKRVMMFIHPIETPHMK
ncbi:hypothetical protein BDV26DRAFT_253309 [Aspergillus bertholletiae]|uniref:Uncharacterized protein n=1 Tax=Aspergillus bertholletiae TaxID=1226010 RepID=A0A5N7BLE4_9EURO|nr:hypothetical protein BDV26DRAFT_253309 [Aspergillus bertholletiae]